MACGQGDGAADAGERPQPATRLRLRSILRGVEQLLEASAGYHDAAAEPDAGDVSSAHECVGEPAGDAQELAGFLYRNGQSMVAPGRAATSTRITGISTDMSRRAWGRDRVVTVVTAQCRCVRSPWSTLYGVEAPCLGNALEVMFAAIDEADAGPGGEIDDCS
jgi:hypothetical protein